MSVRCRSASLATAILLAATGCRSTVNPSPPDPMNMPRVVVLGDSLAVSPASQLNFTTELQARADAGGVRARIANASTWGDTTADGLRRLDEALAIDPQVLVVALGANDGLRGVSLPAVERNLTEIIQRAQGRRIRVLLAGIEAPPVNGFDYSIQFHLLFPRLAAKHDIPLVPFLLAGVILNPDMNGPDGIHPNAAGARRIASTVWPYLERMLRQASPVQRSLSGVDGRPPDPPMTPEPPRRPAHRNLTECSPLREDIGWSAVGCFHPPA